MNKMKETYALSDNEGLPKLLKQLSALKSCTNPKRSAKVTDFTGEIYKKKHAVLRELAKILFS